MATMIGSGYTTSYLIYAIFLTLACGVLILQVDVKGFKKNNMHKEGKVSNVFGWLLIVLGVTLYVVDLFLK
ncbi:CLC_0170 family protein [Paenibacillus sp. MCAF20]